MDWSRGNSLQQRILAIFSETNREYLRRWFRSPLVHNVITLYGVHVARYLPPLVVVPYLTRVLTPSGWGAVAFAQGFSAYLTLIVEYGFNLSATREVARARDNQEKLAATLSGVTGAKCLLAILCGLLSWLAGRWVPLFRQDPALLWAATFAALAQSFSLLWLFQGLERMKVVAALDISAKVLVSAAVFVWIHSPGDGWRVLALQGGGALLVVAVGFVLAYRWIPTGFPTRANILESLRMGWTMFLFRSSVSLYTVGNSFILGLFVAPQFVGYYGGAEKISTAFLGLFSPVSQVLFPRLSYLVEHSRDQARRLARQALAVMGTGGLLLGVTVFVTAPLLVRVILGPEFLPAVAAVRILSVLFLFVGLSNVLGMQWMLPLGMDYAFNVIILTAGGINLFLAVILAPRYAHLGMAAAVATSEILVTTMMFLWLRKKGLGLFSLGRNAGVEPAGVTIVAGSSCPGESTE